jgi:glutamate N-acetyltransferase/amino-acid N-acetyltransferase
MKKDMGYSVPGFTASAVSAGLKKGGLLDLCLIFSQRQAVVAGMFTTNTVKAAPVLLSQARIKRGFARAVLANSGCANACTGEQGLRNAIQTTDMLSHRLEIDPDEILVASTGVIGAHLPVHRFQRAVPALVRELSPGGFESVAKALMTTDTFPKMSYFEGTAGGAPFHLMGIAKGAGMIMPDMATMLSILVSDIAIDYQTLWPLFRSVTNATFNRVTVDGETSTNDMVLIMANGAAGNSMLDTTGKREFERGLTSVMGELSYLIAKDGEGASKVVIIELMGAATDKDAYAAARTVSNSYLVKTAVFGQDPNWGRIMAALGRSGIMMEEHKVQISINGVVIVEGGVISSPEKEKEAAEQMKNEEITITIHLNQGNSSDRIVTCDLTYDYIKINAEYRT